MHLPSKDTINDVIGIWDGQKVRISLDMDSTLWAGAKALLRILAGMRQESNGFFISKEVAECSRNIVKTTLIYFVWPFISKHRND